MAGDVGDRDVEAAQGDRLAVGQFADVVRLGERDAGEQPAQRRGRPRAERVAEPRAVTRMDVRGNALGAAYGRDGEHVVDMTVREQDRDGAQPVPGD